MSNNEIKKENKPRKGCQASLTFQTYDLAH